MASAALQKSGDKSAHHTSPPLCTTFQLWQFLCVCSLQALLLERPSEQNIALAASQRFRDKCILEDILGSKEASSCPRHSVASCNNDAGCYCHIEACSMQINVSSGRALKSSLCARRSTVLARTRASMQSMVWRSLSARRRFRPGGTGVAISLRERTSAPAEHVPLRDHQPQLDELLNATAESLRNPRDA